MASHRSESQENNHKQYNTSLSEKHIRTMLPSSTAKGDVVFALIHSDAREPIRFKLHMVFIS